MRVHITIKRGPSVDACVAALAQLGISNVNHGRARFLGIVTGDADEGAVAVLRALGIKVAMDGEKTALVEQATRRDLEVLAKIRAHPMRDGAVRAMRKAIRSVEQDVRFDPECDKDKAMGLIHVWFEMIALMSPEAKEGAPNG